VIVSAPGVTFQTLDGRQAAEFEDELIALHAEVYGEPGGQAEYARRLRVWRRQPGFVLATAHHGEYLVGQACGMRLRPSTDWWRNLTTPLPESVTAEHPGRTFALAELAVRASWRRQGIAWSLYDLVMSGRTEERATLTVSPNARSAQQTFRNWGWQKVGRARGPDPETPVLDVLVLPLPVAPRAWLSCGNAVLWPACRWPA
jgi:ribosomal protein S18 acetylase RimI-like enzyme